MTSVPVMSLGMRSGVNWMRLKPSESESASERIISGLGQAGTPTNRQCPRAKERHQQLLDDIMLADDHFGKLGDDAAIGFVQLLDGSQSSSGGMGCRRVRG